jgi:hypothetical protein
MIWMIKLIIKNHIKIKNLTFKTDKPCHQDLTNSICQVITNQSLR